MLDKKKDMINHPDHYTKGIEVFDYVESWEMNFYRGNVIKYTTRAGLKSKHTEIEDLQKAIANLEREIDYVRAKNLIAEDLEENLRHINNRIESRKITESEMLAYTE